METVGCLMGCTWNDGANASVKYRAAISSRNTHSRIYQTNTTCRIDIERTPQRAQVSSYLSAKYLGKSLQTK